MKRQQITDRQYYDVEDKNELLYKTNFRCGRCGKQLGMNPNSTLDHFVPLSKGGINQKLNIVPLCEECNKRKSNKIVDPEWYLKYIRNDEKAKLIGYFESYLKSFQYLSRRNILACDMYEIKVYTGPMLREKNEKKRKAMEEKVSKSFLLERVFEQDRKETEEFFEEYLKKHGQFASRENVRMNIEFWTTFGVIYIIRDEQTNQIRFMVPITVQKDEDEQQNVIMAYAFSQYSGLLSSRMVGMLPAFFIRTITNEQKELNYIRFQMNVLKNDKAFDFMKSLVEWKSDSSAFMYMMQGYKRKEYEGDPDEEDETKNAFYRSFRDVKKHLDTFLGRNGYDEVRWMGEDVLRGYCLQRT